MNEIKFQPIGVIRTPYHQGGFVPSQPLERDDGESRIELAPEYADALTDLARFSHVYVLFHLHEAGPEWTAEVTPPWAGGRTTGLFASRSPRRPNPIALSIVRLRRIEGSTLFTDLMDAHDGSPVIDVKPYIKDLDARPEATNGWIQDLKDHPHLLQHLRGKSHDHAHHHDQPASHDHHDDHHHDHHHHDDHEHHDGHDGRHHSPHRHKP